MDLKEIMSVSGQSGLFKFISQGRNGIIIESFSDKKRTFINASQKVNSLGDIAVFTDGEEIPLKDVLKKIHDLDPGVSAPDAKSSPEVLRKFMEKVLPNYDRERVYISDIKKLVTWYNTLLEMKLLNFEEEAAVENQDSVKETAQEVAQVKEKPAKSKKTEAAKKTSESKKK